MSSKIIINRPSAFLSRTKNYKVLIDGNQVGLIKNDHTEEYIIEPGKHTIQCAFNWYTSNEKLVDIPENETEYLKVTSSMKLYLPLYILMLIGLALPLVFRLSKSPVPGWVSYTRLALILPAVFYFGYYIIVNRKNYLKIEKDTSNPFSK